MGLCQHGYTAFWDCPLCECPGCGRPQDLCTCHDQQQAPEHATAEPAPRRALVEDWVQHEVAKADRNLSAVDELVGTAGLVLVLIGAFFALHLQ